MADTSNARSLKWLGKEFNEFLFSCIGTDRWGRQVTVVSALARLDMDPWAEAERLSRLPDAVAMRSLSTVLSRLPDIAQGIAEGQQTALRLVQLLPNRLLGRPAKSLATGMVTPVSMPRAVAAAALCALAALLTWQTLWQLHRAGLEAPPPSIASGVAPGSPPHGGH